MNKVTFEAENSKMQATIDGYENTVKVIEMLKPAIRALNGKSVRQFAYIKKTVQAALPEGASVSYGIPHSWYSLRVTALGVTVDIMFGYDNEITHVDAALALGEKPWRTGYRDEYHNHFYMRSIGEEIEKLKGYQARMLEAVTSYNEIVASIAVHNSSFPFMEVRP